MSGQRELVFDGLAGGGELAGQGVIPVPGVDTSPHPSDGCGLCGWDGVDDPCPEHRGPVAAWNEAHGYTPGTEPY